MFKKLFAWSEPTAQAAPQMDLLQTIEKLSYQINIIEKRKKKIDADMKRHLQDALARKKAGDFTGALFELKRKKILE